MVMMKKIFYWLVWPVAWAHEGIHELLARLLGIFRQREFDYVLIRFENTEAWKIIVVILGPAIVGSVGLCVSLIGGFCAETFEQKLFWSCGVWMAFWWTAACWADIFEVGYFLKNRVWHGVNKEV